MRIQPLSDLHIEYLPEEHPGRLVSTLVSPEADVLVLAGDIHEAAKAPWAAAGLNIPIVMVAGNHEWYRGVLCDWKDALIGPGVPPNVHLLDQDVHAIGDVRFIGCTLWTDYDLFGDAELGLQIAESRLNDHRLIYLPGHRSFTAEDALAIHRQSRAWLLEQLERPWHGPTVVVTHHAPHIGSVAAWYRTDPLTPAFASDLTPLLHKADLWIHGHMHNSADYRVGRCRVVCNPRGYRTSSGWENPAFDPSLTIEVAIDDHSAACNGEVSQR
jgi:predicted phosphodiesterase